MKFERNRKSLLVVEDDGVLRGLISRQLEELGYRVQPAKCWRDAADVLERSEPDLIILDMRLPDCGPFYVCYVRAASASSRVA